MVSPDIGCNMIASTLGADLIMYGPIENVEAMITHRPTRTSLSLRRTRSSASSANQKATPSLNSFNFFFSIPRWRDVFTRRMYRILHIAPMERSETIYSIRYLQIDAEGTRGSVFFKKSALLGNEPLKKGTIFFPHPGESLQF